MMLNIFHDLRSPLFAVSSGLDTLEAAPEALPALLPALQQRTAFLRRLTEDLFLAAKLEQKQVMLNEDRVSLGEVIAAVCDSCREEAEQKGVVLQAPPASELPVWGDQIRLQQILQNLLTNAIHYTPAGGSITVNSRVEAGAALVSVRDTGCGIAPEDQTAVFDPVFPHHHLFQARLHRSGTDHCAGACPPAPRRNSIGKRSRQRQLLHVEASPITRLTEKSPPP